MGRHALEVEPAGGADPSDELRDLLLDDALAVRAGLGLEVHGHAAASRGGLALEPVHGLEV